MSAFDSNPFQDPVATSPFSDPSVTQVTRNVNPTQGLDDYNPFADQGKTTVPSKPAGGSQYGSTNYPTSESVMRPEPPPAYTQSSQQRITTEELERRQAELERKAEELARREEELKNQQYNARMNNWPPLPEKCCVGPCFYQDINVDIPMEFQKIVRTMYYLWMFHAAVLLLNIVGSLALMIAFKGEEIGAFFISIVYFILMSPAGFVCWFRPIYKAFRSDSSFNFFVFFFMFFFQCISTVIFAVGLPHGAWLCNAEDRRGFIYYCFIFFSFHLISAMVISGWMAVFSTFSKSIVVGIFVLLVAVAFTILSVYSIITIIQIHRIYRSTGASFAKAQQEFASNMMRNEHVQQAAANAAAGAVRSTFNQQAGGDTRY